jgi:hypothetical protein
MQVKGNPGLTQSRKVNLRKGLLNYSKNFLASLRLASGRLLLVSEQRERA